MAPLKGLGTIAGITIGGVWIFHGLYSKMLDGIPRHRQIVERILGEGAGAPMTPVIGLVEILIGVWAISGRERVACATVQTVGLIVMNTLEILLAEDLLISAPGMVALNVVFQIFVWSWATARPFK